jgi:murein DD-endopeptidase MepM/ murein hydrolase activator NlpD
MSLINELPISRQFVRVCALVLLGAGVAGCSADTLRFADPNANPYTTRMDGKVAAPLQPAPSGRIESRPLPQTAGAAPAAYQPSTNAYARRPDEVTGSVSYAPPPPPPAPRAVPRQPSYAAVRRPAAPPPASGVHVVAPGETLMGLSRRYQKPVVAIARANNISPQAHLKIGDRITIPGMRNGPAPRTVARTKAPAPKAVRMASVAKTQAPEPVTHRTSRAVTKGTSTVPVQQANIARTADPTPAAASKSVRKAEATGSIPSFRWPVRGRIVTGFGPKTNGQQNDGINLSVPEGTPVKAAEDGVVAYAGNELKGYGNLVLVRHPGGYVTAYAHARELMVKRGDPIKRGQVIAKSGQTGSVSSPQLHFEIRKGAAPVNPMQYLNGA